MERYFIYQDEKSQKFWQVVLEGTKMTVTYGRLATNGQTKEKSFDSTKAAHAEAEKLIREKTKKEYREVSKTDVTEASDEAKRFGYSWDEWEEGKTVEDLFASILAYKKLPGLRHITIANWQEAFTGDSSQVVIDWLVANQPALAHITSLRIADMEAEECEISWIEQGDYSALWQAWPQLKSLIIQGAGGLFRLGQMDHAHLEKLEIICGGLPVEVVHDLQKAHLPNLTYLNLYLGVEDYGFDGEASDFATLLAKHHFPQLKTLGLCNSKIATEITQVIMDSPYAGQLEVLDISKSVFTDGAGEVILANHAKLTNLKTLDLTYHYASDEMMKKLRALPFEVILREANDPADAIVGEDGWSEAFPMFTE